MDSKRQNMDESNKREHYERNVLRVFVMVSGPVGNPESSSVTGYWTSGGE